MRFAAPEHITEIFAPSGPVPVTNGFAELPDDADAADVDALHRAGCARVTTDKTAPAVKAPAQTEEK